MYVTTNVRAFMLPQMANIIKTVLSVLRKHLENCVLTKMQDRLPRKEVESHVALSHHKDILRSTYNL
jgi:hypothetical protein